MRVVRLRQAHDLVVRDGVAVDAPQVREDDVAAQREEAVQEPAGERHVDRRGLRERDRRCARAIVRQRQRDRRDPVPAERRLRARSAHRLRRAVVVARDGEIRGLDLPQRGLARKELDAGFLRGEARGEARGASGPVGRVGELARAEEERRGRRRASRRAGARCARSRRCRCRSGRRGRRHPPSYGDQTARTTSAAFVPAKPRQRISATSLVGACGAADTGTPAQSGSSRSQTRDPGHDAALERHEREHRLEDARRGDQVADRPLEAGDGRRRGAEDGADRRGLGRVGLRRAVAVRDDHPDVGGAQSRRRRAPARIARARPSPSSRIAIRPCASHA